MDVDRLRAAAGGETGDDGRACGDRRCGATLL
jgi:hypothetical protein